jgi:hypothetical protein
MGLTQLKVGIQLYKIGKNEDDHNPLLVTLTHQPGRNGGFKHNSHTQNANLENFE